MSDKVGYLVFDIESVADGELISKVRYPGQTVAADDAIANYREELLREKNSDFIPYTFQIPASIVVAKVSPDFHLLDLVALDEPEYRSHVMTEKFWRGWEAYRKPTLVSFNGRSFDLPLLELAAFRFGISAAEWFNVNARAYDQNRNRYNTSSHLDLYDVLTNFGASRFNGGLNLAAQILGKPGKMDVQGDMVQDLFQQERHQEIADYCRCDVLDTYFVLLRTKVLIGELTLEAEQQRVSETRQWLEARCDTIKAYESYLEQWGDWTNPWESAPVGAE